MDLLPKTGLCMPQGTSCLSRAVLSAFLETEGQDEGQAPDQGGGQALQGLDQEPTIVTCDLHSNANYLWESQRDYAEACPPQDIMAGSRAEIDPGDINASTEYP